MWAFSLSVSFKEKQRKKNSQVSHFRHICIFWERETGASYITNKPGRKTSQNKTCIYFNPVKIIEHLQVFEIWHVKKKFKRQLSFKIIPGEEPVNCHQYTKTQIIEWYSSNNIAYFHMCIITQSTSNFLQAIEPSPIRNEPWYLTGQTVPSYATAAIVSCFSLEQ